MSKPSNAESLIGSARHVTADALLESFHSSASKADLTGYFGCFDKQGRFLGTDATENWSAVEFYDFSKPHFVKGGGWTYTYVPGTRKYTHYLQSDGSPNFCTFDEILTNCSFGTCRGSGSLVFNPNVSCWFIAAYHLTFPVPNDMAEDITSKIKASDPALKLQLADQAAAQLLAELELEDAPEKGKSKSSKKKKSNK